MSNKTTLEDLFQAGLQRRRAVVGYTFVDDALKTNSSAFAQPGQDLVTTWCWGWTWGREGLSQRDRSLLNLAMLMALHRPNEFATHVRGARNNGCSELEIRETVSHATVYCGVPAGVDGMRIAERVLGEMVEGDGVPRELGEAS